MIICLCLLLLQVPIKAIAFDYLMSEEELVIEKESRMKEIASIGLGEDFAGCPKEWVEEMVRHIDRNHGGIGEYVRSIGLKEKELQGIVGGLGL
jgi:protein-tyrosine phosphatase